MKSIKLQISMNVTPDLVVTVQRVRIFQEVTDVNADRDS